MGQVCSLQALLVLLCGSADAVFQMVVDKSCGLQEGIANSRAEKLEAPFFHVAAHGVGYRRRDRYLSK